MIERMPKDGGKTVPDDQKATMSDVVKGTPKGQKAVKKALKGASKRQSAIKKNAAAARGGTSTIKAAPSTAKKKVQSETNSGKMKEAETVSRKATKKPKRQKVDWIAAAAKYVTDASQTFESIAKIYGVHERTVERRAKKEKWSERRSNAGEIIINEAMKLAAQSSEEANTRHLELWAEAQDMVRKRLKHIVQNVDDALKFNPKEMKQVVESLKITIEGERTARGLPNSVVRNQNENKDVDDFADMEDEELERLISQDEHNTESAEAADQPVQGEDGTSPSQKS